MPQVSYTDEQTHELLHKLGFSPAAVAVAARHKSRQAEIRGREHKPEREAVELFNQDKETLAALQAQEKTDLEAEDQRFARELRELEVAAARQPQHEWTPTDALLLDRGDVADLEKLHQRVTDPSIRRLVLEKLKVLARQDKRGPGGAAFFALNKLELNVASRPGQQALARERDYRKVQVRTNTKRLAAHLGLDNALERAATRPALKAMPSVEPLNSGLRIAPGFDMLRALAAKAKK